MNNRIECPAVVFRPAAWIAACLVAGTVAVGDASAEVPSREPGGQEDVLSRFSGEPLSVNFQDVEVRSVLQLIADFAGLNLVVGSEVTGRMTLHLVDVAWDEALEVVLTTNGLGKRLTGSVLRVAPADEFAAQERLQLERLRAEAELAPLETKLIRVRHADAGVLASLLDANGDSAELERGRVIVDPRTNSLVLTDTADNLVAAEQLIDQLDIPVRQVQIEARIVNANSNFSEQLGIRLGGGGFTTGKPPHVKFGGSLRTLSDIQNMLAGEGDGGIRHPDDLLVDLGVEGRGTSSIGIGVTDAGYLLDMELSALAAEGHAEIVARPKVITADKHSAVIESGVEIPFQQATESGATSIAFKDAVLQLEVTPQITPDDRIVIDLTVKTGHRWTHLPGRAQRQHDPHLHPGAGRRRRHRGTRRHLSDRPAPDHRTNAAAWRSARPRTTVPAYLGARRQAGTLRLHHALDSSRCETRAGARGTCRGGGLRCAHRNGPGR